MNPFNPDSSHPAPLDPITLESIRHHRKLIAALLVAAIVAATPVLAQTDDPPRRADQAHHSVTTQAATGSLTLRYGMPAQPTAGPAPAFSELDHGGRGWLDENDAGRYPLLAADFLHADANRDGRISRHEYRRWVDKP